MFGAANAANPTQPGTDPTADWQTLVSNRLRDLICVATDGVAKLNSKLFGGDADIDLDSTVQDMTNAGILTRFEGGNAITDVFATGTFLPDLIDNALDEAFDLGLARIKLSLVAGLLRAQKSSAHIDTTRSASAGTDTGSRVVNDLCAIVSKRDNTAVRDTVPVDKKFCPSSTIRMPPIT